MNQSALNNLVETIYMQNTILGVVILALITLFLLAIPAKFELGKKLLNILLPLFIIVICLELFVMNNNMDKLSREENQKQITQFVEANSFYGYLNNRLKTAQSVKVVHLSSAPMIHLKNDIYSKIINEYVQTGKLFERVFIANNQVKNYELIKDFVNQNKNNNNLQQTVYFVPKDRVFINNVPLLSFIIIDNNEVITGFGGDAVTEALPIIPIKSSALNATYSNFFKRLKDAASIHSGDDNFDEFISTMNVEIKRIENQVQDL